MAKKKKKDPERKAMNKALSKKIGERFKEFRSAIKRTQKELAEELKIYQSTIANFEKGNTFPNIGYLVHFYEKYGLNIRWLITGESHMLVLDHTKNPDISYVLESTVQYGDPRYDDYVELLKLMKTPIVERVIMTKLDELKVTFKEEIQKFEQKEKEK